MNNGLIRLLQWIAIVFGMLSFFSIMTPFWTALFGPAEGLMMLAGPSLFFIAFGLVAVTLSVLAGIEHRRQSPRQGPALVTIWCVAVVATGGALAIVGWMGCMALNELRSIK
ncbi:MAG: hypothetical protein MN733_21910 [Nitrososphaera sp.]|nr:hypothetical protein [Nitrososphaera sp.]